MSNMESSHVNNVKSPPEYVSQPPPKYVPRQSSSSSSSISDQESDIHNPPQRPVKINYRLVVLIVGVIVLIVVLAPIVLLPIRIFVAVY